MKKITILRSVALIAVFCIAAFSLFKSSKVDQSVQLTDTSASTSTDSEVNKIATTSSSKVKGVASSKISPIIPTSTSTPQPVTVYKNGQYEVVSTYRSPGGSDDLGVSLTILNDVVTDSTITEIASNDTSARYQENFIEAYKEYVVGKKLSELKLDKVAGASLTTRSFNDAVIQIKSQAKL